MIASEMGGNGQETELKLLLLEKIDPEQLWHHPVLKDHLMQEPTSEILSSTYYDTRDCRLLINGLTYRIRKENKQWTATVKRMGKAAGGLHQRDEWNMILTDSTPRPEEFEVKSVRAELMSLIEDQLLVPLLRTEFKRTKAVWHDHENNEIEIALDQGEIITPSQNQPISEIELEIKRGNQLEPLFNLGAVLSDHIPMIPGDASKFQRGLEALGLSQTIRQKKKRQSNNRSITDMTLDNAVPKVLVEAFKEVLYAFHELNREQESPEAVHRMRVKVREMRALLSFFKPHIQSPHDRLMKDELGTLASHLTPVRELDVMAYHFKQFQDEMRQRPGKETSTDKLEAMIGRNLDIERRKMQQILCSGGFTPGLLHIQMQLHTFRMDSAASSIPLSDYFLQRMGRWVDRFLSDAAHSEINDMEHIHRIRIQAKRIRYAASWLDPDMPELKDKTISILKKLQDIAGELHDIQCERKHLREWMTEEGAGVILMTQAGIHEGWQQNREFELKASLDHVLRKVSRNLKGRK